MNYFIESIKKGSCDFTPNPYVAGFGGSPRKNGNTDILLKQILKGAGQKNLKTESFMLRDYEFQPCIGCERCRKDKICTGLHDGMSLIYPCVIEAKGMVLVSPTHNYNITAWMKAFIDRLYCFYDFDTNCPRGWKSRLAGQGRKAVLAAICEQETKKDMGFTLDAMRLPLKALGYEIVGELSVFKIFDKGGVRQETDTLSQALQLGSNLAEAILS